MPANFERIEVGGIMLLLFIAMMIMFVICPAFLDKFSDNLAFLNKFPRFCRNYRRKTTKIVRIFLLVWRNRLLYIPVQITLLIAGSSKNYNEIYFIILKNFLYQNKDFVEDLNHPYPN